MKKILVAIDFTEDIELVLDYTKIIAKAFEAKVRLIHSESVEAFITSFEPDQIPTFELIEAQKKVISKKLDELKKKIESAGIETSAVLMEGPTVDSILEEAKKFKAELIILGSHKHGKFYHIIAGSIHDSIVSHSNIPVLIVPPEKKK